MHDGRIRKAEMLNFATANSEILLFNFPHDETLHKFQELRHTERLTYGPYCQHLRNIISRFPIDWKNIQEMDNFDVNKLEWFLILLHIGQLSSGTMSNTPGDSMSQECSIPENDTPFGAISNLQSQLGMENQSIINEYALNSTIQSDIETFFNLSSIPFGHHTFMLVSQTNKLVSKVGELIDIWLSLVAGQQISNMMKRTMTSQWEEECYKSSCEHIPSSKQSNIR